MDLSNKRIEQLEGDLEYAVEQELRLEAKQRKYRQMLHACYMALPYGRLRTDVGKLLRSTHPLGSLGQVESLRPDGRPEKMSDRKPCNCLEEDEGELFGNPIARFQGFLNRRKK